MGDAHTLRRRDWLVRLASVAALAALLSVGLDSALARAAGAPNRGLLEIDSSLAGGQGSVCQFGLRVTGENTNLDLAPACAGGGAVAVPQGVVDLSEAATTAGKADTLTLVAHAGFTAPL
jgi:hypothetical protein